MTVQFPAWLVVLIFIVLALGLWLVLLEAVIVPALNWLVFNRVDRLMRRRLGIPERKDDASGRP